MHEFPASCTLDQPAQREQRERYARLAGTVKSVRREAETLVVEFGPGLDTAALDEALEVERECCPFFRFDLDRTRHTLTATVDDSAMLPALDAIEHGFRSD